MGSARRTRGLGRQAVIGTALLMVTLLLPTPASAQTGSDATISLFPSSGPPGSEVQVTGVDYYPGAPVDIRWDSATGPLLATTTVDDGGRFTVAVEIPHDASEGSHGVFVVSPGARVAAWAFLVESVEPVVVVGPGAEVPGAYVQVSGHTFDPDGEDVAIHWGEATGPLLGTASVDSDGRFATTVIIPSDVSPADDYVIFAIQERGELDVLDTSANFIVEPPVCPTDLEPAPFRDRESIPAAHLRNVDCATYLGVVQGSSDGTYGPTLPVRRDQMATLIAGVLDAADVELPLPADSSFEDVSASSPHWSAIHRLAAAGIVQGGPSGLSSDSYGPGLRVRRDQMATFLLRTAAFATDLDLTDQEQAFGDVPSSNTHFPQVNGAAELALVQGYSDGTYRPGSQVRRDQAASFVIRLLEALDQNAIFESP